MDCDEALAEVEAFLDNELSGDLRQQVEEHLSSCSPCFERGEFRRRLRVIVKRKCSAVAELPPTVAERIRGAIASSD